MKNHLFRLEELFNECFIEDLYKPKSLIEEIKFSFKKDKLCKYRYYDKESEKTFCKFYIQTQPFFPREYLKNKVWKPEITD
jgi:hypothetical protein